MPWKESRQIGISKETKDNLVLYRQEQNWKEFFEDVMLVLDIIEDNPELEATITQEMEHRKRNIA